MSRRPTVGRRALWTAQRALGKFFADGAPQSAAAISYYALLSLCPLAILLVIAFAIILDAETARGEVIRFVLNNVPLREDHGRRELEDVLVRVTRESSGFGVVGGVALVVSASAVMGAIRSALNRAWDVEDARPFAQAKLIDLLLVLGLSVLVGLSFALTLVARLAASAPGELEQSLRPAGAAVAWTLSTLGQALPMVIAFAAFLVLFRVAPAARTRVRDVWPGAVIAVVGFEATKTGFALYLAEVANYSAVYASLAAVVAFLVFVFVSANIVLFGAEVAAEWPRVRQGSLPEREAVPLRRRVRGMLAGLFVRQSRDAHGVDLHAGETRRPP